MSIRRNVRQFDFTGKDPLTNKVIMHLDVLGPGVEYAVSRKVDTAKVVAIDRRRIGHLHM